jgi:hypothetical protein
MELPPEPLTDFIPLKMTTTMKSINGTSKAHVPTIWLLNTGYRFNVSTSLSAWEKPASCQSARPGTEQRVRPHVQGNRIKIRFGMTG